MEHNQKRSHNRIVVECYMELKRSEHPDKVFARYGRKTGQEAFQMLKEEHAKDMGMTMEEYEAWLESDD